MSSWRSQPGVLPCQWIWQMLSLNEPSQGSVTSHLWQITLPSHWSQLGFQFPSLPGFKTQFRMTSWVTRSSGSCLRGLWFWASTVKDVLRMVRHCLLWGLLFYFIQGNRCFRRVEDSICSQYSCFSAVISFYLVTVTAYLGRLPVSFFRAVDKPDGWPLFSLPWWLLSLLVSGLPLCSATLMYRSVTVGRPVMLSYFLVVFLSRCLLPGKLWFKKEYVQVYLQSMRLSIQKS